MARYRQIHVEFWSDPDFEELTIKARYLYIYLFTNSHRNEACLYKLSRSRIAFETGLSPAEVSDGLVELSSKVCYDDPTSTVWVVGGMNYQTLSPNCLKAVQRDLQRCPCEAFVRMFCEKNGIEYQGQTPAHSEGVTKPLARGYQGVTKGLLDLQQPPNSSSSSNRDSSIEEEGNTGTTVEGGMGGDSPEPKEATQSTSSPADIPSEAEFMTHCTSAFVGISPQFARYHYRRLHAVGWEDGEGGRIKSWKKWIAALWNGRQSDWREVVEREERDAEEKRNSDAKREVSRTAKVKISSQDDDPTFQRRLAETMRIRERNLRDKGIALPYPPTSGETYQASAVA